jgi:hypothetical protein
MIPPPGYMQCSGQHPQIVLGAIFSILADFSIFSGFLN